MQNRSEDKSTRVSVPFKNCAETHIDLLQPIVPQSPSAKCYLWNHDTAQFHSEYSPDGRLFACWSGTGSLVRVRDTQTGQLVGNILTLSPGDRLIVLLHRSGSTMGFIYTVL